VFRIDFFVVGVQKAGTTALSAYLGRQPAIQIPCVKELHFFDDDSLDWDKPDYGKLSSHFSWGPDSPPIRGEATPNYLYWPNALERLHRYNPSSKLLVILRHPAYRAHSHWRMETKRGEETISFEAAISAAGRRRVQQEENGAHRIFSYVERGLYADQISRLLRLFPREQVIFLQADEIWRSPDLVLDRIHAFLGAPAAEPIEREYIVPIETRDLGPISRDALASLNDFYRSGILELGKLTGLNLDNWLSPDYAEAMPGPVGQPAGALSFLGAWPKSPLADTMFYMPSNEAPLRGDRKPPLAAMLIGAAERSEETDSAMAARFASDLRKYFPDLAVGYRIGTASARKLQRLDEAAEILGAAPRASPTSPGRCRSAR